MVDDRSAHEMRTASASFTVGLGVAEFLQILLIFAVVGPLVGTVIFAFLVAVFGTQDFFETLAGVIFMGPATGASYIAGGIPAAVAGLILAIKHVYFGGAGWRFVLATGVLMGIALGVFFDLFVLTYDAGYFGARTLGATATLSTLACWRMVQHWFTVPA